MNSRRMAIALTFTVIAAALLAWHPASANAAAQPVRESGYLTTPDGARLKWTVLRPPGAGRFPVLMQYEGYNAGNNPTRANDKFAQEMLADGYAVLGVSMRGTACSSGIWDPFLQVYGQDGKFAVEWATKQPWSNSRVGMFSFSFAGIMQLHTAGNRPNGIRQADLPLSRRRS